MSECGGMLLNSMAALLHQNKTNQVQEQVCVISNICTHPMYTSDYVKDYKIQHISRTKVE